MTKKHEVDLETYKKAPRLLSEKMETALLQGELKVVLDEARDNPALRFDIRSRCFNLYYQGGSMMVVSGARPPWKLKFDLNYFEGSTIQVPPLPDEVSNEPEAAALMERFPTLRLGMEDFWSRHPNTERAHSQGISAANGEVGGTPSSDCLIIDIEYQWAQRSFDLIAARRNPTPADPIGWMEPRLVFVEVKSAYGACKGKSGLGDHARDFRDIVAARDGVQWKGIKRELWDMLEQKKRLSLVSPVLPFERFAPSPPELLLVLVDLDPLHAKLRKPWEEVEQVVADLGDRASIHALVLKAGAYAMTLEHREEVTAFSGGRR